MKEAGSTHHHKDLFYDLETCCQRVARKYHEKEVNTWSNLDYVKLSGIIYRQTNVQISASTLKRVFGKFRTTERYYPQQATRDALAQFAGFANWDTFVQQNPTPATPAPTDAVAATSPAQPPIVAMAPARQAPARKRILLIGITLAIALIAIAGLFLIHGFYKKETAPHFEGIAFGCTNPEGKAPHSALFHLKVPANFTGDSHRFEIGFGDNKKKAVMPVGTLSHYYELPGRYYAYLKYDDLILDSTIVFLTSNGWEAIAEMERDTMRVYPVPLAPMDKAGSLTATTKELLQAGVDTNHTFYVHFSRIQSFGIGGDDFELTTRVNTSAARPGVRCSQITVQVYGERSKHSFMFLNTGCVSWGHLTFSEKQLDGATDDLGFIGANLSQGGLIRLHVQHKQVTLSLNDQPVYTTQYHQPLNNIYGLRISFAGIGAIDSVGMKDLKSGRVISEFPGP